MWRLLIPATVVALVVVPASPAPAASPPLVITLTSDRVVNLVAPHRPFARAVVTISSPRMHLDGDWRARLRVRTISFPEHRSFFLKLYIGNPEHGTRVWTCEEDRCLRRTTWSFSRTELRDMRQLGASIQAFIWAPSGYIYAVARGQLDIAKLVSIVVRA